MRPSDGNARCNDMLRTGTLPLLQSSTRDRLDERALADAKAQRDRDLEATRSRDGCGLEQAGPGIGAGAAALVEAVTKRAAVSAEAKVSASVDAVPSRGSLAADLICWEWRPPRWPRARATRTLPTRGTRA